MDRHTAAQLLGISVTASRQEARAAYLRLLAGADPQTSSDLDRAYATFANDEQAAPTQAVGGIGGHSSADVPRSSRRWVLGAAALGAVGLIIAGLAIAANDSSSDKSTSAATASASTPSPPSLDPTPDRGQSGFRNTCWQDAGAASADGSVPLKEVNCSWDVADWLAYRETLSPQGCGSNPYMETPEGWFLCLRSN